MRQHSFGYGGTLLEVLIGLVILSLVLTSVVDAMGQNRRAQAETQWHDLATRLAMQWRQARLTKTPWSLGEQGTFEQTDATARYGWKLEQISFSGASIDMDAAWRKLVILDSASHLASEFLMRIGDLQPITKEVK